MLGKTVGSYEITKELGEGGMGAVYLAEHTLMGKQAAVKVLLPQFCAVKEVVDRFFNEAKSASMIKHPGIVDIYDFGTQEDGSAFIVMELLEGEELSDLLEREPRLASERVARLGQQMAKALEAAHELGIVHRDLKPDNVFLEPDPAATGGVRPKILDFGIAKLGGDLGDSSVKTRTGAIMGTPVFMSPEQCTGAGGVDHRSDIYSLACILYLMVCGRPPFVKPGAGGLIAAHIAEAPEPLSAYEPAVDPKLEAIIMSGLAKSPDERPQSMAALANALGVVVGSTTAGGTPVGRASTADLFGAEGEDNSQPSSPRFARTQSASGVDSTTLGASAVSVASTQEPARAGGAGKSRLAIAGLGLVGAAAAAFFVLGARGDEPRRPEPAAAAQTAPAPAQVAPAPTAAPALTPTEETSAITIALRSEPPGAGVYRRVDGVKLGTTPYEDEFPRGRGELELTLKREGFESVELSVPLADDFDRDFSLEAIAKAPEKRSARKERRRKRNSRERKATAKVEPKAAPKKPEPRAAPKKPEPKPEAKWGELAP